MLACVSTKRVDNALLKPAGFDTAKRAYRYLTRRQLAFSDVHEDLHVLAPLAATEGDTRDGHRRGDPFRSTLRNKGHFIDRKRHGDRSYSTTKRYTCNDICVSLWCSTICPSTVFRPGQSGFSARYMKSALVAFEPCDEDRTLLL